jgi:hypothetical protein
VVSSTETTVCAQGPSLVERVLGAGNGIAARSAFPDSYLGIYKRMVIFAVTLEIGSRIEEHMNRAHLYVASLVLAGVRAAPTAVIVAAQPQDASVQIRVYDRDHRDYHNWDDREDHAYRGYLTERHREYRAYEIRSYCNRGRASRTWTQEDGHVIWA